MKITYRTEIKPTAEQINQIKQNIGTCCWIYNQYIMFNIRLYRMYQRGLLDKNQSSFISANEFEKIINYKVKKEKQYYWIAQCSSYAKKFVLISAEKSLKRFYKNEIKFPKLKKYNGQDVKLHLKNVHDDIWIIQRHRVNIPTLGFIKLKEYGYLPINVEVLVGVVSCIADKYYVSITVDKEIDNEASVKEDVNKQQFEKTNKIEKLIKKIRREKRCLYRKYANQSKLSGCSNIIKQEKKVKKLEQKLKNIRQNIFN